MPIAHDHEAKEILETLLHRRGEVRAEAEVASLRSQRADLLFVPLAKPPVSSPSLGVLGRMTACACLLEPFSDAPSTDDVRECLRKLLNHRHARTLKRPPRRAAERSWLLCAGRPSAALDTFGCAPMAGWPSGFYELRGLTLSLVVLSELPARPDTLALRLLGVGATRASAFKALCEAPEDFPARTELIEIVIQFERIRARESPGASEDSMLDVTEARALLKRWRNEGREEGRVEGRVEGRAEGRVEGLRIAIEAYCEAVGIALDGARRAWIAEAPADELEARLTSLRATRDWR
ncbi:MAG: hypothetical protein U0326_14225 [Polyangiales bacterium]